LLKKFQEDLIKKKKEEREKKFVEEFLAEAYHNMIHHKQETS
jgi:hypothetical protein